MNSRDQKNQYILGLLSGEYALTLQPFEYRIVRKIKITKDEQNKLSKITSLKFILNFEAIAALEIRTSSPPYACKIFSAAFSKVEWLS